MRTTGLSLFAGLLLAAAAPLPAQTGEAVEAQPAPGEEGEIAPDALAQQLGELAPIEAEPVELEPVQPVTEDALEAQELEEASTDAAPDAAAPDAAAAGAGEFEIDQEGATTGALDLPATSGNRLDDRTLALRVPGPRGLITDRHGDVLAYNEVAWKVGIRLPKLEGDERRLAYVHRVLDRVNAALGTEWTVRDEVLLRHYENRRWLPLLVGDPLDAGQKAKLDEAGIAEVDLRAMYLRVYPEGNLACHVIGYAGRLRPLPTGPIQNGDPLFEEWEGRSGLEALFDPTLQGRPGRQTYLFDADGNKQFEDAESRPVPGNTVVSTLDLDWQRHAENVLRANSRRSAAVVLDIYSGEVLVLASNPGFDLNDFIPYINDEDWQALQDDPSDPLLARAFQELYCPASTFKVVTCTAGLESGAITGSTYFSCPPSITLGNTTFVNWNRNHEGSLNVVDGLKRSNNVFMYQCVKATGSTAFTEMAQRFGFGRPTGLPLPEQPGLMPTDEWFLLPSNGKDANGNLLPYWERGHGWRRTLGNNYNESIGQGDVTATPVQVARMMAAIANGGRLPILRLVNQVQDVRGRIIQARPPAESIDLRLQPTTIGLIQRGLEAVVSGEGGTGRSAAVDGLKMAAKTGTGQWTRGRNIAWFAGYVPADRPRYAFAFLYEGARGESVSGGRTAGSMAREFFEPLANEINGLAADSVIPEAVQQAAEVEVDDTGRGSGSDSDHHGGGSAGGGHDYIEPPPSPPIEAPPVEEEEPGFFRRLFNFRFNPEQVEAQRIA